ncbi:MAG: hypothetical protein R3B84_18025 [Zavarzinella sp.]
MLAFAPLDTELRTLLPDSDAGMVRADALFEVYDLEHPGQTVTIFVHFEVKAQRDPQLPERMFDYYCRIRQKYGKNVCSFAILADDDPRWRSEPFEVSICGTRSYFEFNEDGKAKFFSHDNVPKYDFSYVIEDTRIKLTIYNGYSWFEGEITENTMQGTVQNKAGRSEPRTFSRK